ncbi:MAG: DDE-type integrase/transposase/recombinase [Planctomycetaceae bacterium]
MNKSLRTGCGWRTSRTSGFREGWLYLPCVLDAYSRKIVGWSMSDCMTKDLVLEALRMALDRRRLIAPQVSASSPDRQRQYASEAFQQLLREEQITCSISRKGNCWDNARWRASSRRAEERENSPGTIELAESREVFD